MPKPDYPQEAKEVCADGIVNVDVTIDENGDVVSAEAVSGDELLREPAVQAAKKAKFRQSADMPVKLKGIVVYNFPAGKACFSRGIVNEKATFLPQPAFPKSCRCAGQVSVKVVIDERGGVIRAQAVSGHPLLRVSAEDAARRAKFPPINDVGKIRVKGILIYNFDSNAALDAPYGNKEKYVIGKAQNLVKLPLISCNCKFGGNSTVAVLVEISQLGNVIKASAVSGHPVLRSRSERAARFSKFSPTLISGVPVKAKAMLAYEFAAVDKWSMKLKNIIVKEINAIRN
ncbi:MAG: energy transducer TonB [Acidobacteriota bacterium]|nr:energy transducer TonB [Acidobacteriota bacterium]